MGVGLGSFYNGVRVASKDACQVLAVLVNERTAQCVHDRGSDSTPDPPGCVTETVGQYAFILFLGSLFRKRALSPRPWPGRASVSRAGRKPTDDIEFPERLVRSLALPAGNLTV
jgi:hypothetical protein